MPLKWITKHTDGVGFLSALTVFSAAVQGGLGRAGGDVEEAIHEERSIRQGVL